MKKSQVTLFVIIGITVLVIVGIFLGITVTRNKRELAAEKEHELLSREADLIEMGVEQCLSDVSEKATYLIALQGGYIDPEYNEDLGQYRDVEYKKAGFMKIPYWYYSGKDNSLSLSEIEVNFERYVLIETEKCIKSTVFSNVEQYEYSLPSTKYKENHFDLSKELTDVYVHIAERVVTVDFHYPIILKGHDSEVTIEDFYTRVDLPLGRVYEIAHDLFIESKGVMYGYDVENYCKELNKDYINIFALNKGLVMVNDYEISFRDSRNQPLSFQFYQQGLNMYGSCLG